ncbi:hypothetical protein KEF85_01710 [Methylomonas paludis]|uniref:IPTL-CTERM protein sorting domain-containing protein n=1 Tax=Methylomonas paludis TaxID=1173101 RepID=A0A975MNQ4_9GAMM|nr:hypothetical protein [Methylomonas paludis]QWF71236.1 hypothetical protein KEF85_01710 [Methylomonas paludis]
MKLKLTHCSSVIVLALGLCHPAFADFSNYYNVANWTINDNAGGSVDLSSAPASVTLTSGNAGIPGDTIFSITAEGLEKIAFDWSYTTNDLWGESGTDAFGYVLNGNFTTLIDPNQDSSIPTQSGSIEFIVNPHDVFGFDANTLDGYYGSAVTVVSNFTVTAVPLTETIWMFSGGLLLMSSMLGRRRLPA